MDMTSITFEGVGLFVKKGKTIEEKAQLKVLVSQTRTISRIAKSTALHIIDAFEEKGTMHVVTIIIPKGGVAPKFGTEHLSDLRKQILSAGDKKNPTN